MKFCLNLRKLTLALLSFGIFFVLSSLILHLQVAAASCIPPNEDVTGCSFDGNGSGVCPGVYKELDDPPKCDRGFDRIRQYTCKCSYTNKAYLCPDGRVRFNNNVWTGSTIDPVYIFCGNIQNEVSTVSKLVATDLAACQDWCKSIESLPSPTPVTIQADGYSRNQVTNGGIPGARVVVKKYSTTNCTGAQYDCGESITNGSGYFKTSCTDAPLSSMLIQETCQVPNFLDSYSLSFFIRRHFEN